MAMFRSLVASAQQRQPPGGPAGGDSGLEAQYSCPICLEVYHRPVAIGSCGHTTLAQKLLLMEGRAALRPTSALQVLRGVPPAVSAGAIPPVPTVPPALRPQESGQGRPRGEAAFVLQGTLPGLQQEDTLPVPSWASLACSSPGTRGLLPPAWPHREAVSACFWVRICSLRGPESVSPSLGLWAPLAQRCRAAASGARGPALLPGPSPPLLPR
uniref:E3 ubiquitin-protein ligase RNF166 isoform X3 n=1 Tax=Tursiops truncatus TaxID=9739 RepID=A0A6J3QIU5_TURTR|nr:E3 ubiquitin-protein ligase RNF166 isoform X3 [Tursiops truncatus]